MHLVRPNPLFRSTSQGPVCRVPPTNVRTTRSDSPVATVGSGLGLVVVIDRLAVVLVPAPTGWTALTVQPARVAAHKRTTGILSDIFMMIRRRMRLTGST